MWEEGMPIEELLPSGKSVSKSVDAFSWLMWKGLPHGGCCPHWQVVLCCIRKQAELIMQGKLVTAFPQGLVCVISCLQVPDLPKLLSWLPSMMNYVSVCFLLLCYCTMANGNLGRKGFIWLNPPSGVGKAESPCQAGTWRPELRQELKQEHQGKFPKKVAGDQSLNS